MPVTLKSIQKPDEFALVKLEDGSGSSLETCSVWRWWQVRRRGELVSEHTYRLGAWLGYRKARKAT